MHIYIYRERERYPYYIYIYIYTCLRKSVLLLTFVAAVV